MLKLTYTETGLHLEQLSESIEEWIALRVMLTLRASQSLQIEPGTASFLLPIDLVGLEWLQRLLLRQSEGIMLSPGDSKFVEVSIRGIWLASQNHEAEGVFVVSLNRAIESLLFQLWQTAETQTSSLRR